MIRKSKVIIFRTFIEPEIVNITVKDVIGTFEGKEITFSNTHSNVTLRCKKGDKFTEEIKVLFKQISEL